MLEGRRGRPTPLARSLLLYTRTLLLSALHMCLLGIRISLYVKKIKENGF